MNSPITFTELKRLTRDYLDKVVDAPASTKKYLTGLRDLDASMDGARKGEMVVIGGRPSNGKSLLALQWAMHAVGCGQNVLFVSEEMGADALAQRCVSFVSGHAEDDLHDDYATVADAQAEYWARKGKFLTAIGTSSVKRTVEAIEAAVQQHAVEIAFVDYLQLLAGQGSTPYERVTFVSRSLKACAVKHDIVLVALAQLGRAIETRDNTPQLRDLKDSGQIEQDADQVIFVQWPLRSDPKFRPFDEFRLFCAKNRNRAIKSQAIKMRIVPHRQMITAPEQSTF